MNQIQTTYKSVLGLHGLFYICELLGLPYEYLYDVLGQAQTS
jgi:hypothetical protein